MLRGSVGLVMGLKNPGNIVPSSFIMLGPCLLCLSFPLSKYTCQGKTSDCNKIKSSANPPPPKKTTIKLGRIVKNNHFRVLETKQRQMTTWEKYLLIKYWHTLGKNNGILWHSCLGLPSPSLQLRQGRAGCKNQQLPCWRGLLVDCQ